MPDIRGIFKQPTFDEQARASATVRSFERQMEDLVKNMKELVGINKGLLDAMNQIAPPVGTRPGTPPGTPHETHPAPKPSARPRGRKPVDYDDREQTEETFGPSPLNKPNSRSNDSENASRSQRSYFTEYQQGKQPKAELYGQQLGGVGGPGINQATADAVSQGAMQGFRLPRYGEFNTQDLLNLAGNATASGAEALAGQGIKNPTGIIGSFANSNAGGKMIGGLAGATRVSNAISNVVPYVHAFQQMTGIPMSLSGQNAQGTSMGYNQGGTNVGPFRIPGLGIGLGGVSISPAMTQGIQNSWQSFKYGLTPGGSSKLMEQTQAALQGEGWSGSTMRNMAGQYGRLAASQNYGNIGTPQELAPVMDQLVRYGSGGLDNLTTSLKKIPDAALAANQSIAQTVSGLNSFAQSQQASGATYSQGFNNAANMTVATGLTPQVGQSILSNGAGQAMASALTGGKTPVFAIGQAPLATQMAGQLKLARMEYEGVKSAYGAKAADAYIGQNWGITPEAAKTWLQGGNRSVSSAKMLDQATKMNTTNNDFLNGAVTLKKGDTAQDAWKVAEGMGYTMTDAQKKQMAQFTKNRSLQGHGFMGLEDYSRQQDLQYGFTHELAAINEQRTTPQLKKEAMNLGMSNSEWKKISEDSSGAGPFGVGSIVGDNNVSRAGAGEISNRLSGWVKNHNQEIQNRQNALGGTFDLTPAAKRLVNLSLSNYRNKVNDGSATANTPAATSSVPASAYTGNPGGFTPAGAGLGG